jgi:hypothetical protein
MEIGTMKRKVIQKSRNLWKVISLAGVMTLGSINSFGDNNLRSMNGSIDGFVTSSQMVLDTKVSHSLSDRIGLFGRNLSFFNKGGKDDLLGILDASYGLNHGLGLLYELTVNNEGLLDHRTGFQYSKENNDLFFLSTLTFAIKDGVDEELLIKGRYKWPISNNFGFVEIESITGFDNGRLVYDIERSKLGIQQRKISYGIQVNTKQLLIDGQDFDLKYGAFLGWRF